MSTKDLIAEANSLPIEERAMLVNSLLKSFNLIEKEIDQQWLKVAKKRLSELWSEIVKPVSGEKVFEKIRKKFHK